MNQWAKLYAGVHEARLEGTAWITVPQSHQRLRIVPLTWDGGVPTVAGTHFDALVTKGRPGGAVLGHVNATGEQLQVVEADAATNWIQGIGAQARQRPGRIRTITWDDVLAIIVERTT